MSTWLSGIQIESTIGTSRITIHGVPQVNKKVEFFIYDDDSLSGRQLLQTVITDALGIAHLTEPVPSGKILGVSVHIDDNGTLYDRFRLFTDEF